MVNEDEVAAMIAYLGSSQANTIASQAIDELAVYRL